MNEIQKVHNEIRANAKEISETSIHLKKLYDERKDLQAKLSDLQQKDKSKPNK